MGACQHGRADQVSDAAPADRRVAHAGVAERFLYGTAALAVYLAVPGPRDRETGHADNQLAVLRGEQAAEPVVTALALSGDEHPPAGGGGRAPRGAGGGGSHRRGRGPRGAPPAPPRAPDLLGP